MLPKVNAYKSTPVNVSDKVNELIINPERKVLELA